MQCMVHEETVADLEERKTRLRKIISGSGELQCWGWKHYQSTIEMSVGDSVGDNQDLFARGDWVSLKRDRDVRGTHLTVV